MIIPLPFQKTTGGKSKADRENFQVIGHALKRIFISLTVKRFHEI